LKTKTCCLYGCHIILSITTNDLWLRLRTVSIQQYTLNTQKIPFRRNKADTLHFLSILIRVNNIMNVVPLVYLYLLESMTKATNLLKISMLHLYCCLPLKINHTHSLASPKEAFLCIYFSLHCKFSYATFRPRRKA
jgi:hypothetical protein